MSRALLASALVTAAALAAAQNAKPGAPLELSLSRAVIVSLENSPALKVQVLSVAVTRTAEKEQAGAFDPVVSAGLAHTAGSGADDTSAEAGAAVLLPTGTVISADAAASMTADRSSAAEVAVTQPLLQGAFPAVNLARVREARLDSFSSRYALEAYTASLLSDVETAYWELYLAGRELEITRESLTLAERQLEETQARVEVGRLPEIELAAAEAEVASRKDAVLTAEGRQENARVTVVRLLNPPGSDRWEREIRVIDSPDVPADTIGAASEAVAVGMRRRPDLAQARLAIERGDLEVVRTRNGVLPSLEVYLSGSGASSGSSLGESLSGLAREPDLTAGLRLEVPIGNRAASARSERAVLSRRQADEALRNLELLAEADIRSAHIDASRARRQIESTAVLEKLQRQKLDAETEKFRVGTSTAFLVAQAQRDLLSSQLAAVQSSAGYLEALVRLYRSEGTLLERRGVQVSDSGVTTPEQPAR